MVAKRHSREDRDGDPKYSPFRSYKADKRYVAAMEMVVKRTEEISALERLLGRTKNLGEQKRLTTRLLASKNNLKSWRDYLAQNYPHVKGAVIIP